MSSHSCWNRNWQDSERLKYHNDKMLTKKKRAEQQTVALGLKLDININVVHHYLV